MKKQLLVMALALAAFTAGAQSPEKKKGKVDSDIGYAQAVKVGNTIYLSGKASDGDMATAITRVYSAFEKTLGEFGATYQNVVKENVYSTNLEDFIKNKDIRKKYFNGDFPAATWVGVNRLYLPEFVLEVELIAVLKE